MGIRVQLGDQFGFGRDTFDLDAGPQVVDLIVALIPKLSVALDADQIRAVRYVTVDDDVVPGRFGDFVHDLVEDQVKLVEVLVDFGETARVCVVNHDFTTVNFLSFYEEQTVQDLAHSIAATLHVMLYQILAFDAVYPDHTVQVLFLNDDINIVRGMFVFCQVEFRSNVMSYLNPWPDLPPDLKKHSINSVLTTTRKALTDADFQSAAYNIATNLHPFIFRRNVYKREVLMYINHVCSRNPSYKVRLGSRRSLEYVMNWFEDIRIREENVRLNLVARFLKQHRVNKLPQDLLPKAWRRFLQIELKAFVVLIMPDLTNKAFEVALDKHQGRTSVAQLVYDLYLKAKRRFAPDQVEDVTMVHAQTERQVRMDELVRVGETYKVTLKPAQRVCYVLDEHFQLHERFVFDEADVTVKHLIAKTALVCGRTHADTDFVVYHVRDRTVMRLEYEGEQTIALDELFIQIYAGQHPALHNRRLQRLGAPLKVTLQQVLHHAPDPQPQLWQRVLSKKPLTSQDLTTLLTKMVDFLYTVLGREIFDNEWTMFKAHVLDKHAVIKARLRGADAAEREALAFSAVYRHRYCARVLAIQRLTRHPLDFEPARWLAPDAPFFPTTHSPERARFKTEPVEGPDCHLLDHNHRYVDRFRVDAAWDVRTALAAVRQRHRLAAADLLHAMAPAAQPDRFRALTDPDRLVGHQPLFVVVYMNKKCPQAEPFTDLRTIYPALMFDLFSFVRVHARRSADQYVGFLRGRVGLSAAHLQKLFTYALQPLWNATRRKPTVTAPEIMGYLTALFKFNKCKVNVHALQKRDTHAAPLDVLAVWRNIARLQYKRRLNAVGRVHEGREPEWFRSYQSMMERCAADAELVVIDECAATGDLLLEDADDEAEEEEKLLVQTLCQTALHHSSPSDPRPAPWSVDGPHVDSAASVDEELVLSSDTDDASDLEVLEVRLNGTRANDALLARLVDDADVKCVDDTQLTLVDEQEDLEVVHEDGLRLMGGEEDLRLVEEELRLTDEEEESKLEEEEEEEEELKCVDKVGEASGNADENRRPAPTLLPDQSDDLVSVKQEDSDADSSLDVKPERRSPATPFRTATNTPTKRKRPRKRRIVYRPRSYYAKRRRTECPPPERNE